MMQRNRHERFRDVVDRVGSNLLAAGTLPWTGARAGEAMADVDRQRILDRIRSVYEVELPL